MPLDRRLLTPGPVKMVDTNFDDFLQVNSPIEE